MNPSHPKARRSRASLFAPERLEGRELMTGGVGDTFAIIPATISKANGHAVVSFDLNPKLFTDPGHKPFLLGVDVAPNSGSPANPMVTSVTSPTGKTLPVTHAKFDPAVTRSGVMATSSLSSAGLVQIPGLPAAGKSFTYKVNVSGLQGTSGAILVGFYLPGNASGTGTVNQSDLNAITYALGTNANDTTGKYTFDADSNRDGLINKADLTIAQKNFGVGTTVSPVISANLDPATTTDPTNRITNTSTAHITGTATPYASVTFSEPNNTPVTVSADATGNYSITVKLNLGANTFSVATSDLFGQKITGSINSITYNPAATVPTTPAATSTTSTTTTTSTSTTASTPAATSTPGATPVTSSNSASPPASTSTTTTTTS
jgi:hypothetical protein